MKDSLRNNFVKCNPKDCTRFSCDFQLVRWKKEQANETRHSSARGRAYVSTYVEYVREACHSTARLTPSVIHHRERQGWIMAESMSRGRNSREEPPGRITRAADSQEQPRNLQTVRECIVNTRARIYGSDRSPRSVREQSLRATRLLRSSRNATKIPACRSSSRLSCSCMWDSHNGVKSFYVKTTMPQVLG